MSALRDYIYGVPTDAKHAVVVRSDARAMSSVTALDVRVSERWHTSDPNQRTFGGKRFSGTSECISYDAQGNATVFTRARKPNRATPKRYTAEWADVQNKRFKRSTITAAQMAPILDSNH